MTHKQKFTGLVFENGDGQWRVTGHSRKAPKQDRLWRAVLLKAKPDSSIGFLKPRPDGKRYDWWPTSQLTRIRRETTEM